jgi:glycosyltransferase involved in cell wall biosynthesis
VVIPCRNAARTLGAQLEAIASQNFTDPFEVIVVDNLSTDGSAAVALAWVDRLPQLRVVPEPTLGINAARNAGVRASSGEVIAICDADDVADRGWLTALSHAFADGAGLVGGALDLFRLNEELSDRRRSNRRGPGTSLGFLPWAEGANMAFRRRVYDAIGGFDESYRGGGDEVDFAWRAQLAGYRLDHAPDAIVHYATRRSAAADVKQFYHYGKGHVRLYRQFATFGMPPSSMATALRWWWWLLSRLPLAATSTRRRETWVRRLGLSSGRLVGSAQLRTWYP